MKKRTSEKPQPAILTYLREQYRPDTAANYHSTICRYLTLHPLAAGYTYPQVTQYLFKEVQRLTSRSAQSHAVCALKSYYRYLQDAGVRTDHPIRHFRFTTQGNKKPIQLQNLLTPNELKLLLKPRVKERRKAALRNRMVVSLMVYQGLAPYEIAALRLSDFNLADGKVRIKRGRLSNGRILPLEEIQLLWMQDYCTFCVKFPYWDEQAGLFYNLQGNPISTENILTILEQLRHLIPGKYISPMTIRKSVIANWLNIEKQSLVVVQERSGFRCVSSVQNYKRMDLEEKRALINRFHPLK